MKIYYSFFLLFTLSYFLKSQDKKINYVLSVSYQNNFNNFIPHPKNSTYTFPVRYTGGISIAPQIILGKKKDIGIGINYSLLTRQFSFKHSFKSSSGSQFNFQSFENSSSNDLGLQFQYYFAFKKSKISLGTDFGVSFNTFNAFGLSASGYNSNDSISALGTINTNYNEHNILPYFTVGISYYSPSFARNKLKFFTSLGYQHLFGDFLKKEETYNETITLSGNVEEYQYTFNGRINNFKLNLGLQWLINK